MAGTNDLVLKPDEAQVNATFKSECSWSNAYAGYSTRNVIMEERNVLCGQYNVLVMKEKHDIQRVCHLNGPTTIAFSSSFDQKLRFIDIRTAIERPLTIQGHAGSIRCVYIYEKKRVVITGSYDTSIRMWSIDSGKCLRIYQGHTQTVTCVSMFEGNERFITGSVDGTCKVWLLGRKKCWRTFKHRYQIVSAAIGEEICASGGRTGKIKIFDIINGTLVKKLSAHQGPVNQVKFDRWHLASCGSDCYAQVYSTQGKHKKCLIAMRHPKPVLCLEFLYLRAITGASDGKIRIWNILNGKCLRVMRGNSQSDAILSMSLTTDMRRLLVNTENHILLMEFEKVEYEYGSDPYLNSQSLIMVGGDESERSKKISSKRRVKSYSFIRASRSELVSTPNVKLFDKSRDRVSIALDHSARPISARNIKDARLVHRVTASARQLNIPKNSFGNISDFALMKRLSLVNNIQATIQAKKSSLSSCRIPNDKTSMDSSLSGINQKSSLKIDQPVSLLSRFKNANDDSTTGVDLDDTKKILRDQLKERKQLEQTSEGRVKLQMSSETEVRSCVERSRKNRIDERPRSSPSRLDTKTRVKLNAKDFDRFRNHQEEKPVETMPAKITPPKSAPEFKSNRIFTASSEALRARSAHVSQSKVLKSKFYSNLDLKGLSI